MEAYSNGNISVFRELYHELPFERGGADLLERDTETDNLKR